MDIFPQRKAKRILDLSIKQGACTKASWEVMKILWIDHGGEYISKPFIDYYKKKKNEVQTQLTICHASQQNGLVECKNITYRRNC